MAWNKPVAREIRCGMEINMYGPGADDDRQSGRALNWNSRWALHADVRLLRGVRRLPVVAPSLIARDAEPTTKARSRRQKADFVPNR
ncbi:coenzyme PQQ synthesis protein PqqA [Maliponia aquimaris]|uniref:Coenzyme PQQ synthesis protein A n=1 Tax=Maliponia aquimaris TaxID=1673631 RepID=A0A238JR59_9RHOB|nr:coenzyme PQQ synthesis protein PqqA [Maliponia aquimaris]